MINVKRGSGDILFQWTLLLQTALNKYTDGEKYKTQKWTASWYPELRWDRASLAFFSFTSS